MLNGDFWILNLTANWDIKMYSSNQKGLLPTGLPCLVEFNLHKHNKNKTIVCPSILSEICPPPYLAIPQPPSPSSPLLKQAYYLWQPPQPRYQELKIKSGILCSSGSYGAVGAWSLCIKTNMSGVKNYNLTWTLISLSAPP